MVEIVLDPYDAFRDGSFVGEVTEMGIKTFGEKETLKAYLEFDDGGSPITFFINKSDGSAMIEEKEEKNIKSFLDLGAFATSAKNLGYKTIIDLDPDNLVFRTEPDMVGQKTVWLAKKSPKKIDASGEEGKEYTNFFLVAIDKHVVDHKLIERFKLKTEFKEMEAELKGLGAAPGIAKDTAPAKASGSAPQKKSEPAKPSVNLKEAWKELLIEVLAEKPLNVAGIQLAINAKDKGLKSDDPQRILHTAMAKERTKTLGELVSEGFLNINEDAKYEVVV